MTGYMLYIQHMYAALYTKTKYFLDFQLDSSNLHVVFINAHATHTFAPPLFYVIQFPVLT